MYYSYKKPREDGIGLAAAAIVGLIIAVVLTGISITNNGLSSLTHIVGVAILIAMMVGVIIALWKTKTLGL